jgi:hypothetical protein
MTSDLPSSTDPAGTPEGSAGREGTTPAPGYAAPGHVASPGYTPAPGYVPPGYVPPAGYPSSPGYGQPGPGSGWPPAPSGQWAAPPMAASPWSPYTGPYAGPWAGSPYLAGPGIPGYFDTRLPPAGPVAGLAWAGTGVRFGALVLDAILAFVSAAFAGVLAETFGVQHYLNGDEYSAAASAVYLVWVIALVLYHPVCWYLWGCSLGQRVLGLRVVRAADGGPMNGEAVVARFLIFAICTGLLIAGIGAAFVAVYQPTDPAYEPAQGPWILGSLLAVPGIVALAAAHGDPLKRAWHDRAARSVVVRRA